MITMAPTNFTHQMISYLIKNREKYGGDVVKKMLLVTSFLRHVLHDRIDEIKNR